MSSFDENKPKTGSGHAQPENTRMVNGNIKPEYRDASGKPIARSKEASKPVAKVYDLRKKRDK